MKSIVKRVLGLDYADGVPLEPERRKGLNLLYWNAAIAMFAEAAAANYTTLYLIALRASNAQIGLLGTLVQIFTALAPIPSAIVTERTGAYKANVIVPNLIARAGFILLIALPFLQIGEAAIGIAIAIFAARAFLQSWSTAPWTAFVAKLVPMNIRANYFSGRNFIGGIATILGAILAGQVIGALGFPAGYQAVFLVSLLVGLLATWSFWVIPFKEQRNKHTLPAKQKDAEHAPGQNRKSEIQNLKSQFNLKTTFGRYMLCSCALAFGVGVGGPFIQVYQVKALGFSAAIVGIVLAIELGSNIIAQRVYGGAIIPRLGDFRVMRFLRFLTPLVPLLWIFVQDPIAAGVVSAIAGLTWSGHELANFNNLLAITPEDKRASYIATHTFAVSMAAAIGPAMGGVLSDLIGFQPLFALSAVLRFGAAVLLVLLVKQLVAPASPAPPADTLPA
jgi:MFS family permease